MRTKKVFSNSLATMHAWVGGNGEARNSSNNVYAVGDRFYSYGSHFELAVKFSHKYRDVYFINTSSYSSTTSSHQSDMRAAIHGDGRTVFYVDLPYQSSYYSYRSCYNFPNSIEECAAIYIDVRINQLRNSVHELKNGRNNFNRRYQAIAGFDFDHVDMLTSIVGKRTMNLYYKAVNKIKDDANQWWETIGKDKADKYAERERIREEKLVEQQRLDEERREQAKELLIPYLRMWCKGNDMSNMSIVDPTTDKVVNITKSLLRNYFGMGWVRCDGDNCVTLGDVSFSRNDGLRLVSAYHQGLPIVGNQIAGFSVSSASDGIRIGCHHFTNESIEMFLSSTLNVTNHENC
jgi:hypothetical protein